MLDVGKLPRADRELPEGESARKYYSNVILGASKSPNIKSLSKKSPKLKRILTDPWNRIAYHRRKLLSLYLLIE